MMSYSLPDGSQVNVDINPQFLSTHGKAYLKDPDDIEGQLRSYPDLGQRPDFSRLAFSVSATVRISPKNEGEYAVGFKQLAKIEQMYSVFYGKASEFGWITEQATGPLTGRWLLDCDVEPSSSPPYLSAPHAPFYLPKETMHWIGVSSFKAGGAVIKMADQPDGGKPLLRRNNGKRQARNYLAGKVVKIDFLTFVVVEQPDGLQIPVQGFSWRYDRQINVEWSVSLEPRISADMGGVVQTNTPFLTGKDLGSDTASLFKDRGLKDSDSIVLQMNQAMQTAKRSGAAPGYHIVER